MKDKEFAKDSLTCGSHFDLNGKRIPPEDVFIQPDDYERLPQGEDRPDCDGVMLCVVFAWLFGLLIGGVGVWLLIG